MHCTSVRVAEALLQLQWVTLRYWDLVDSAMANWYEWGMKATAMRLQVVSKKDSTHVKESRQKTEPGGTGLPLQF